ncbi:MAG: hypothetical protein JSV68_08045 [Anaerolineaceae bacterium]|jgi:hypothetical protein|nr:MAG: hypothetical protein JSV68_08045 [Anaerolineaceae bacterium]
MRGLIDRKGEQFAYFVGDTLYTLEDEPTGRLQQNFIVDLSGNRMWRVIGDGVYSLDGMETIGYISSEIPDEVTR